MPNLGKTDHLRPQEANHWNIWEWQYTTGKTKSTIFHEIIYKEYTGRSALQHEWDSENTSSYPFVLT